MKIGREGRREGGREGREKIGGGDVNKKEEMYKKKEGSTHRNRKRIEDERRSSRR